MNQNIIELLKKVLPYVEGAYECAFPDSDENFEIAENVRGTIKILSNPSEFGMVKKEIADQLAEVVRKIDDFLNEPFKIGRRKYSKLNRLLPDSDLHKELQTALLNYEQNNKTQWHT